MFNVRPDTPWIHFRPDEDDPPGFRIAQDGSVMNVRPGNIGSGSFGLDPGAYGVSPDSNAYGAPYSPSKAEAFRAPHLADGPFNAPTQRPSIQEALDQLARIYAGVGGSRFGFLDPQGAAAHYVGPIDPRLRLAGTGLLRGPVAPSGRGGGDEFVPLSEGYSTVQRPLDPHAGGGNPLLVRPMAPQNLLFSGPEGETTRPVSVPPATLRRPARNEGEVLSDATSNDGLRDGQQYAQYRPPLAKGGVRVGRDEEGRDGLIPDKPADEDQRDPFEKLKQRGYPMPPNDPANGSAMVKELREREQYGPHHAGYHRYEFTDHLCDRSDPGCTFKAAYEALLRHAVPGGPAPGVTVAHQQESPVSLLGVSGGRVRTLVDQESSSIINHTLPNHQFHNGFVQRQIVEKDGKVYLRTFGEGNNSDPMKAGWNRLLAKPAFEESTAKIRAALRPADPIGQKWPR